jgi:hypothetical protein
MNEKQTPMNLERAATAVVRSRRLLREVMVEVRLASQIVAMLEDEGVEWASDPRERVDRLGWLEWTASLAEASSRSLERAWPTG